jgi:hypothetical protein
MTGSNAGKKRIRNNSASSFKSNASSSSFYLENEKQ